MPGAQRQHNSAYRVCTSRHRKLRSCVSTPRMRSRVRMRAGDCARARLQLHAAAAFLATVGTQATRAKRLACTPAFTDPLCSPNLSLLLDAAPWLHAVACTYASSESAHTRVRAQRQPKRKCAPVVHCSMLLAPCLLCTWLLALGFLHHACLDLAACTHDLAPKTMRAWHALEAQLLLTACLRFHRHHAICLITSTPFGRGINCALGSLLVPRRRVAPATQM